MLKWLTLSIILSYSWFILLYVPATQGPERLDQSSLRHFWVLQAMKDAVTSFLVPGIQELLPESKIKEICAIQIRWVKLLQTEEGSYPSSFFALFNFAIGWQVMKGLRETVFGWDGRENLSCLNNSMTELGRLFFSSKAFGFLGIKVTPQHYWLNYLIY